MPHSPLFPIVIIGFLMVNTTGCKKPSQPSGTSSQQNVHTEAHIDDQEPPDVMFDIKQIQASAAPSGSQLYDCSYQAGGKIARFRLQLRQSGPTSSQIPAAIAEGKFLAVAGSDNSVLLAELKNALEAKHLPTNVSRAAELPFDVAVLAEKQSRGPDGGYSSNPPGDWMATKIFLPKADDQGEVFLNINPILGKAEFSMKDPDYGDYVLQQLATVL